MITKLDIKLLQETFKYNQETGNLTLLIDRGMGGRFKKGSSVGALHTATIKNTEKQYLRTSFNGSYIYVHRIIWALMTKEQPENIDHIDGNGLNNRWSNLRSVSHRINCKNQKLHSTNTSGKSGITFIKERGKWRSRIMVDGKSISLGNFIDKEDAIKARIEAEKQYEFYQR